MFLFPFKIWLALYTFINAYENIEICRLHCASGSFPIIQKGQKIANIFVRLLVLRICGFLGITYLSIMKSQKDFSVTWKWIWKWHDGQVILTVRKLSFPSTLKYILVKLKILFFHYFIVIHISETLGNWLDFSNQTYAASRHF